MTPVPGGIGDNVCCNPSKQCMHEKKAGLAGVGIYFICDLIPDRYEKEFLKCAK